jgi:hypothetical protein
LVSQNKWHKQCSITYQPALACLVGFIKEAFARREHVVAVFIDLEKAYDLAWQYGIL